MSCVLPDSFKRAIERDLRGGWCSVRYARSPRRQEFIRMANAARPTRPKAALPEHFEAAVLKDAQLIGSTCEIARRRGVSYRTVRNIITKADTLCPCGHHWGHRGFCYAKYLHSAARKKFMRRWQQEHPGQVVVDKEMQAWETEKTARKDLTKAKQSLRKLRTLIASDRRGDRRAQKNAPQTIAAGQSLPKTEPTARSTAQNSAEQSR